MKKTALDWVDPFIGVDGPGATLCGPYHPLAIVRLGPDTVPPHRTNGYRSDFPIQGFSHTHVSGTGGQGRFGTSRITVTSLHHECNTEQQALDAIVDSSSRYRGGRTSRFRVERSTIRLGNRQCAAFPDVRATNGLQLTQWPKITKMVSR